MFPLPYQFLPQLLVPKSPYVWKNWWDDAWDWNKHLYLKISCPDLIVKMDNKSSCELRMQSVRLQTFPHTSDFSTPRPPNPGRTLIHFWADQIFFDTLNSVSYNDYDGKSYLNCMKYGMKSYQQILMYQKHGKSVLSLVQFLSAQTCIKV